MDADLAPYVAIALMVLVTTFVRYAGATVMARIGVSPRVEAFLNGLAVAVMVAVVASFIMRNGPREAAAVAVAILAFLWGRNTVLAMAGAVAFAAAWRALAG